MFTHSFFTMECDKCKSKLGYLRLKTKKWICRNCGTESKILDLKQMAKNFAGIPNDK